MSTDEIWAHRSPPDHGPAVTPLGSWPLRTPVDLTSSRGRLRAQLASGVAADDLERLLLAYEELTSNGLRHGRPPVRVDVLDLVGSWLIVVSDAAVDSPPTPAVDRDPAAGGLGLYLVARLSAAHGWCVREGRKLVWALIGSSSAGGSPTAALR